MTVSRLDAAGGIAAVLLVCAAPAGAVIKVDFPVSDMYKTSQSVWVGKVASLRPDSRVAAVTVQSAAKGPAPPRQLFVQVLKPAEVFPAVAVGQDAVLFVGKAAGQPMGIVHLADCWLLAKRLPGEQEAWRVEQRYDAIKAFPGRTAALAGYLAELKAGKGTLLDHVDPEVFRRPPRLLGKLDAPGAAWLAAADVNGDGKLDVLVGTAGGTRLFLAGGEGYRDATAAWAVPAGKAAWHAIGDVNGDGRSDLLLDGRVYLNGGAKFAAAWTAAVPKGRPLAAALLDAEGDGRTDALLLDADGELCVTAAAAAGKPAAPRAPVRLWKGGSEPLAAAFGSFGDSPGACAMVVRADGIVRYALDGGPPADFRRLAGVDLQSYYERYRGGLKGPRAVAIDINADRRDDLLVLCDAGGLLLVNRGFGAFLVDYDAGGVLAPKRRPALPFKLTAATPRAAADVNADGLADLIILADDGRLFEIRNVPSAAARAKAAAGR